MPIITEKIAGTLARHMMGERDYPHKIHTNDEVLEAFGRARQVAIERRIMSGIAALFGGVTIAGFTAIQVPENNFDAACSVHENGEVVAFDLNTDEPLTTFFARHSDRVLDQDDMIEDTAAIIEGHCSYYVWKGVWFDKQQSDAFPGRVAGYYLNPENNSLDFMIP